MGIEIVKSSVLKIWKMPINFSGGIAEHYYLSETQDFNNSIGWGTNGIELRGSVRLTEKEIERLEKFLLAAQYSVAIHNCEHFANYVLYGLSMSTQQDVWWKLLPSVVINILQPTQNVRDNYNEFICQQISEQLKENLRQAKIKRTIEEQIQFWANRQT